MSLKDYLPKSSTGIGATAGTLALGPGIGTGLGALGGWGLGRLFGWGQQPQQATNPWDIFSPLSMGGGVTLPGATPAQMQSFLNSGYIQTAGNSWPQTTGSPIAWQLDPLTGQPVTSGTGAPGTTPGKAPAGGAPTQLAPGTYFAPQGSFGDPIMSNFFGQSGASGGFVNLADFTNNNNGAFLGDQQGFLYPASTTQTFEDKMAMSRMGTTAARQRWGANPFSGLGPEPNLPGDLTGGGNLPSVFTGPLASNQQGIQFPGFQQPLVPKYF